jgi:hypothetical protein
MAATVARSLKLNYYGNTSRAYIKYDWRVIRAVGVVCKKVFCCGLLAPTPHQAAILAPAGPYIPTVGTSFRFWQLTPVLRKSIYKHNYLLPNFKLFIIASRSF